MVVFIGKSVGIEICGNDLRLAITRSKFGKLRLIAVHRIVGFMALSEEERKKAVKTLFKNHGIPTGRVYLALHREQGMVRQVDLPAEMAEKLADVVRIQVETLSPWPLEEIYWDFARESQKKNRKLITVTIVIVPRTVLDPWLQFFKSAGIPLSGASLSSVAYAHGAKTLWADGVPTFILHREESYIEGAVINEGRVSALTVFSGDDVAARGLVERLLSVGKLPSAEGSRFVLCGAGIDEAAEQENPRLPLENAKPQSAKDFGAIATALLPLKASSFSSNLIPRSLRYRESQLRLVPTYVLGFVAICMGLALLVRGPYQATIYASQLDGEIQKIAPEVSMVASEETELNQVSARWQALTSSLRTRDFNLEALRELARILPETAFLSSYAYQDGTITISGFAQSASEIQSILENSPMFKGAEFTSSVTRDPGGKDRYSLKMLLEVTR